MEVFGHPHWWLDRTEQEKQGLRTACPDFASLCESWLREDRQRPGDVCPVTRAVDLADFDSFVDSLEKRCGPLRELYYRALLQEFLARAAPEDEHSEREPLTIST